MNKIDFTHVGGFPFEQKTLSKMQEAYFEMLKMTIAFYGCNATSNYIIDGFEIVDGNITPGILFMSGDLVLFAGDSGSVTSKIKKQISVEDAPFENGNNLPTYTTLYAEIDSTGTLYTDFIRLPKITELKWSNLSGIPTNIVYDTNYVHTDNNFTTLLKTKLENISVPNNYLVRTVYGRVVNFDISEGPVNKEYPVTGNISKFTLLELLVGGGGNSAGTDSRYLLEFPEQLNVNYTIIINVLSKGNWNIDNDVLFVMKNKQLNSVELCFRELGPVIQNLDLEISILNVI